LGATTGLLRQQYQNLSQDCDRLKQERAVLSTEASAIEEILSQEGEIRAGYAQYQSLQIQEELSPPKLKNTTALAKRQTCAQQLNQLLMKLLVTATR